MNITTRGVGKSDPISGAYLLCDHMEDARAVVEATGKRPVVFVGISRAGALAIHFATAYPHLVQKLVLVGTRPSRGPDFPSPDGNAAWQQITAKVQAGDYEEAMSLLSAQFFSEPGSRNLIEVFMPRLREQPRNVFRDFFARDDDSGRDVRPLLPRLQVPTLVLYGEKDRVVSVDATRYLVDHIHGAQFYLFKGRDHVPMHTATAEFAQVVRNFIRTGRPT